MKAGKETRESPDDVRGQGRSQRAAVCPLGRRPSGDERAAGDGPGLAVAEGETGTQKGVETHRFAQSAVRARLRQAGLRARR